MFEFVGANFIRRSRKLTTASMLSTAILIAIAVFILNPVVDTHTEAATGTATAATTSLTFSSASPKAGVIITPTYSTGTFASSDVDNVASFSVNTNNFTGYSLSISAADDAGELTNADDSAAVLNSISAPITAADFASASATTLNDRWGYKPSKYMNGNTVVDNTGDSAKYFPSPTTTATPLDKTNAASVSDSNYSIALGARISFTSKYGTYAKAFTVTATANPISYIIRYNKNTTDTVASLPETQASSTSETSITLSNNTPTREHYTFTGWCTVQPTTTDGVDACTGTGATTFQPGDTYGIDQTTQNIKDLYAMWKIDTFVQTTQVRYENADGTWGSYATVDTKTVNYNASYSWSTSQITNFNSTAYQSASVTSYTVTETHTNYVSIYRNTVVVFKVYKLQDTSGNYPSTYTADGGISVRYGASYTYSRAATTSHQAASKTVSSVTSTQTISLDVPRVLVACNKRYRLQGADGNYPSNYTSDGSVNAYYGGSCSYSKTVTDYNGNAAKSTSASNVTSTQTLSLDFPRNTYALTVTAGTNTSSATGGGTYRWGQTVTVGVTKTANATCTSYATPTWTQSGTAGTFSSTSGASVNFTMGKGATTVTATSTASNVAQTITLSRSGGASGITIAGTSYTGNSVSLNCGTYNISGSYSNGYEFSSWSRANGVAVANTAAASTTMTVTGAGTLTLNGKSSKLYLQNVTASTCPTTATTAYDKRDEQAYTIQKLADNKCWLLDNLALGAVTLKESISSSNTNIPSGVSFTIQGSYTGAFNSYVAEQINTGSYASSYSYGAGNGKVGVYYNYCAATAGGICANDNTSNASSDRDICPKGWRLPTGGSNGEFQALYTAYSSNADNFKNALHAAPTGAISATYVSPSGQGGGSDFWSATRYPSGTKEVYITLITTSSSGSYVYPANRSDRRTGMSVRCVAK